MKHAALLATFLALVLTGCMGEPAPVPAEAPGANAPINVARSTVNGITMEARLIDAATLGESMAKQYGITQADNTWLLLITLRDADGNGVAADSVQVDARAGGLTDAPAPIALRTISVNGLNDLVGTVQAKAPATIRVEIDAVRDGARAEMRFTRDLPTP